MPIYEYICNKCRSKFEVRRPFSRAHEDASCPHCQSTAQRVMSSCFTLSRGDGGSVTPSSGSGSSCASCGGGSCSSCGH